MVTAQRRALVAILSLAGALPCRSVRAGEAKTADARPDFVPGFSVGARLGVGFPLGARVRLGGITDSMGPSANYGAMVPIWVDAGYRFTKLVYVGGYFQYGFLLVSDHGCPAPITGCSAHDIRAGAAVQFHFMPRSTADLWAGLGFGYEGSSITYDNGVQSATRSNDGIEFANVQVGVDIHPRFGLDWGPFVSFSVDQYRTETQKRPDGSKETYEIGGDGSLGQSEKTLHYFLVLGMRVQFDF
jgi:hypothetical protein